MGPAVEGLANGFAPRLAADDAAGKKLPDNGTRGFNGLQQGLEFRQDLLGLPGLVGGVEQGFGVDAGHLQRLDIGNAAGQLLFLFADRQNIGNHETVDPWN